MGEKKNQQQSIPSDQQEPQNRSDHHEKHPSQRRKSYDNMIPNAQINDDLSPSEQIEAAIKSMKFREKRGTRMKDLMTGKFKLDNFWVENAKYFGGNLNFPEDEDQEDGEYEQSSSGRDEFDSDFDETESYPGKRGRKRGSKLTNSRKGRKPGRKPKQTDSEKQQKQKNGAEKNDEAEQQPQGEGSQILQKKEQKREPIATRSKYAKPKRQNHNKVQQEGQKKRQKLKEKKERKREQKGEKQRKQAPEKDNNLKEEEQKWHKKQQGSEKSVCLKLQMSVKVEIKESSRKDSGKSPLSCQGSKEKSREKGEQTKTIKIDIPYLKL